MSLARKEYVEPANEVTHQAISQRSQMQTFLITNSPLISTIPRDRPFATQDNRITKEDQLEASIQFFGEPAARRDQVTPSATTASYNKPCLASGNLW